MTVNEMTTGVARKFNRETDFSFKRALLLDINNWRSTIIKQAVDKTPSDRKFFTESMYVDMEQFFSILNVDVCPTMCRSVKSPLPATLRGTQYDYVGSIDGYTAFGTFTFGTERYLRGMTPRYNVADRQLFVNKYVKTVKLVGIPDDPEEWYMFNCKSGDCDFWNSRYPVTDDIAQRIVQSLLSVDYRRLLSPEQNEVQVNESTQHNP